MGESHLAVLRVTVGDAWGPFVVLEIQPGSPICKASAFYCINSTAFTLVAKWPFAQNIFYKGL